MTRVVRQGLAIAGASSLPPGLQVLCRDGRLESVGQNADRPFTVGFSRVRVQAFSRAIPSLLGLSGRHGRAIGASPVRA